MNPSSILFRILAIIFGFAFIGGTIWEVRLAWADHLRLLNLAGATRATELDPLNAMNFRAKALYEELGAIDSTASWQRAATLDPRDPRILIPAGIHFELKGDLPSAEHYFREAERQNKLWLPRWTLANYYARRGDRQKSLHWLRSALERSYGEDTAAFQVAVDQGATERMIADSLLPDSENAYGQFVNFMTRSPTVDSSVLEAVALRYIVLTARSGDPGRENRPALNAVDRLLSEGYGDKARHVWDEACRQRVIPSAPSTGEQPIVNENFSQPIVGRGLDWSLPPSPGLSAIQQTGTGTVKFQLNGEQVGTSRLMSQRVVLPAGRAWRVGFDLLLTDIEPRQASFSWTLDGEALPLEAPLRGDEWQVNHFRIPAPSVERVALLSLVVSPPSAAARPRGELWIRNLKVEPLP